MKRTSSCCAVLLLSALLLGTTTDAAGVQQQQREEDEIEHQQPQLRNANGNNNVGDVSLDTTTGETKGHPVRRLGKKKDQDKVHPEMYDRTFGSGNTHGIEVEEPKMAPEYEEHIYIAPIVYFTGDPHLKKWNGEMYDFHGGCDLVLLHNPHFNHGQGLYIHVRTKIQRWWSYIESAAIQIGNDILEVQAGVVERNYWVNGQKGHPYDTSQPLDFTIGGFDGRFRAKNDHVIQYKLFLPDNQSITVRSIKDMLRVELEQCNGNDFGQSLGLMGTFEGGILLGRDGKTVFEDTNAFGLEWQVNPGRDPQLFHAIQGPQFPEQCHMPSGGTSASSRRLLGGAIVSRQQAEAACSRLLVDTDKTDFDNCVSDVMAMDDITAAESY